MPLTRLVKRNGATRAGPYRSFHAQIQAEMITISAPRPKSQLAISDRFSSQLDEEDATWHGEPHQAEAHREYKEFGRKSRCKRLCLG